MLRTRVSLFLPKYLQVAAGFWLILLVVVPFLRAADFTPEERVWIAGHKSIRAGFAALHPPFSLANEAGEHAGIDADLFARLMKGLNVQVLAKYSSSGSAAIEGVQSGELDLLVGVERTPELEKAFLFTDPYLAFPVAIVAGQGAAFFATPEGLMGKRVAVVRSSAYAIESLGGVPVIYDSLESALTAVADERVPAAVADPLEASYVIQSRRLAGLKLVGALNRRHEFCIAVRRDWPELVAILNQVIASVSPREKQALCDVWAPPQPVPVGGTKIVWIVAMVLLCVCGAGAWYIFRRGRRHAQLRAERTRLQRELAKTAERATSLHGEKSRILELASHDVSHPLAGIKAHAARLSSDNLTADAIRESGGEIVAQAARIQKALDALQEIKALDEGSKVINVTTVNVGAVVAEALANLEAAAAKRHVRLSPPSAGKTALAQADVDVLRKVIESLLVGALKMAPADSTISVAIWPAEDRVLISVSDEGAGVSVADQSRVFGSYHHLGASLSDAENSTGYGLALVQNLVKAMQAWLWYESTPGVGATYVIELPLASAKAKPSRAGKIEKEAQSLGGLGLRPQTAQE
jgi:signal transduction histidine kinase